MGVECMGLLYNMKKIFFSISIHFSILILFFVSIFYFVNIAHVNYANTQGVWETLFLP